MAKQSGIHQLKGKVGQMSYYRTKGVTDGLVRGINQGMSARVKNDEAYANTRLNNAEFKEANALAAAAFRSVPSRKRGMMVNFAVARMTKRALEDIKQGTGDWGKRLPVSELDALICDMLENYAKGGTYNGMYGSFVAQALTSGGSLLIDVLFDDEKISTLEALGIDGILYVPAKALAGQKVIDGEVRLFSGSSIGSPLEQPVSGIDPEDPFGFNLQIDTPASVGMSPSGYTFAQEDPNHGFFAVIACLPYRLENNKPYTLQELCTYVAIPAGQFPE